ncbi:hypothetical protein TPADAL_0798a [Treponema pallidum subsp. pallidum DAL-1]|uniref:Uncharacterized protein n=2 Tax=Treponema pallidum TaxID=160 RepID=A0AAU8SAU1_TREPL|nr:hypothetical protein TPESAMD_0798a [Treponema pallidum subsp. pertenue str. SamoaD]AEZ58998.1 hypothetical protein TPECDC2_0798a [Treponema pallidum subsp. pertenue str. CDC2]AEZ60066.1 hypothetical protein TPEGAU_0798a [Treponema pallidum subsp. pertenue str. Gauthier]AEZ61126.1 hypothetical protein TPADAL_0798a [Treponema pallidum subsp. pallidum DAL-1]AGK84450.1 hypothetical protein TPFB_0798a [Treponema pallidum str. Fribourg-Blanc]AJB40826.1 hypothetical protein TENDBA_0798a [Treponema
MRSVQRRIHQSCCVLFFFVRHILHRMLLASACPFGQHLLPETCLHEVLFKSE